MINFSHVYEKAKKALALTLALGMCLQPVTVYAQSDAGVPDPSYVENVDTDGDDLGNAGDTNLSGSDLWNADDTVLDQSNDTDLPLSAPENASDTVLDQSNDTDLPLSDQENVIDTGDAGTDPEPAAGDVQQVEPTVGLDAETSDAVNNDTIDADPEAATDTDPGTDADATDTDSEADILPAEGQKDDTPEGNPKSADSDVEVLLNSAADDADKTLEPSGEAMSGKEAVLGSLLTSTDNKETDINDGTITSDDDIYSVVPSFVVLGLEPEPSKEAESGDGSGDISGSIGSGSSEPQGPSARDTVVDDSGLDLRVGQNSIIDEYLSKPAKEFNQKLAELCADLSYDAYNKDAAARLLKSVGFEEIYSYNYGYWDSFAYTLAVKDYKGKDSDGNTKVLVMDARGTSGANELGWDVKSTPTVEYEGLDHKVHTAADAFYKKIAPNVSPLIKDDVNYKILATGHSLGGAAANLFSAVMMQKKNTDVYCYTYGAIDSIGPVTEKKSVTEGYENIHNIYNDLDTFSPTQYGYYMKGSGKNDGAGQKYGKFGHMDSYTVEHRTIAQQQQIEYLQVYNAINHQIGNYITDIKAEKVKCVRKHDDDYDDDEYDDDEYEDDYEDEYDDEDYEPDDEGDKQLVPIVLDEEEDEDYEDLDALEGSNYEAFGGEDTSGFLIDDAKNYQDTVDFWKDLKQATVIYNSNDVKLDHNIFVNKVNALKGSDGETLVMMEIVNSSDKPVSLAYKSALVDGKRVSLAPWKSGVIPPSKRMMIIVPLSKFVNVGSKVALPVRLYSSESKKLITGLKLTVVDR